MEAKSNKYQQDVKRFIDERKHYETFAQVLEKILKAAVKIYAPLSVVQVRAKNVSSFAEKIIRKNKYKDPLVEITDLCGARVIAHTQEQVDKICGFIRNNFLIDEANSLDVSERLKIHEFGYRSVHFIVTPSSDSILEIVIPQEIKNKKAEIQVRTLAQHIWADVLHDRLYKTSLKIPKEWDRESGRLAALLENADVNISRLTTLTDSYTANYGNRMNQKELDAEIETLTTILENEPDENNKPAVALKIAHLARFKGNWDMIISQLQTYAGREKTSEYIIKKEYGFACCKKYSNQPESVLFKKGMSYLLKASDVPLMKQLLADKHQFTPGERKERTIALEYLAEASGKREPEEVIGNYYALAYQIDPANPFLYAKMLEYKPDLCQQKLLIQNTISGYIRHCREQIDLRIESIKAYFTIGRLALILDDQTESLNAYLKAIDLCVSDRVCFTKEIIDDELDSLTRFQKALPSSNFLSWLRTLLLMADMIKLKDQQSLKELAKETQNTVDGTQPIVVVAGGAEGIFDDKKNKYSKYFMMGVQRFKGTLISGGTKIGIPGILGSAVVQARQDGNQDIRLIGYVPSNQTDLFDKSYDIRVTKGTSFTAWESLCMWRDIIVNNILPQQVQVLGINGGDIAGFEYRIGLALGAHVGIIEKSGRAVDELLKDVDWNTHQNLHQLPDEIDSVWAFINYHKIQSDLSREQLEDIGKVIHENYVEKRLKELRTIENLKVWNDLNDDLKNSNISQARYITEELVSAGFGIRKAQQAGTAVTSFTPEESLRLAKLEHGRFVAERLMSGWVYGPKKDVAKKISPYLIAWEEVPADVQKYDYESIENFPEYLKTVGLEIYRLNRM